MKRIAREIILLILFATPLGYLLALIKVLEVRPGDAVTIQMDGNKPLNVYVNYSSLLSERFRWITHGILLLAQATIALIFESHIKHDILLKLIWADVWLSILLGFTTLISGVFPNFPWNKRPFGISIFEIFFFVSMFLVFGILSYK